LSRKSSSEGRRATTENEAVSLTFIDLNPGDMAKVLTIDEFELFADVPIIEFVAKGGWAKGEKTAGLDRLSERFNKISRWVTTTVVCADDNIKLDTFFLKWIVVAYHCKKTKQFQHNDGNRLRLKPKFRFIA